MEHQYNNTLPPAVNVSPEPPDIQAKKVPDAGRCKTV